MSKTISFAPAGNHAGGGDASGSCRGGAAMTWFDPRFAEAMAAQFGLCDPLSLVRVRSLTPDTFAVALRGHRWLLMIQLTYSANGDDVAVDPTLIVAPPLVNQYAGWDERWDAQMVIDLAEAFALRHVQPCGSVQ
jgi:hypothetical protein